MTVRIDARLNFTCQASEAARVIKHIERTAERRFAEHDYRTTSVQAYVVSTRALRSHVRALVWVELPYEADEDSIPRADTALLDTIWSYPRQQAALIEDDTPSSTLVHDHAPTGSPMTSRSTSESSYPHPPSIRR